MKVERLHVFAIESCLFKEPLELSILGCWTNSMSFLASTHMGRKSKVGCLISNAGTIINSITNRFLSR
jgi:hypothetical protein